MKFIKFLFLSLVLTATSSCIKDEKPNIDADIVEILSDSEGILNIIYTQTAIDIYADAARINVADVNFSFTLSEGATISPNPTEVTDYSSPVRFSVTSEDGNWTKNYTVRILVPEMPTEFDFEHWYQPEGEKYRIPYEPTTESTDDNSGLFIWSCGNEPFAFTVGKNDDYTAFPTQPTAESFDGQYAVKLVTKRTGDYYKPIAAGSLFIGQFDSSNYDPLESTHFGLPFTKKPLRITGVYKYRSGGLTLKTNVADCCRMQAVLYKTDKNVSHLNGYTIKDSPNIVARAEMTDGGGDTAGDGYVEFDMKFIYTQPVDADILARGGYNLAVIFSASRNGDTYDGAVGSVLYVDNVKIICDTDF